MVSHSPENEHPILTVQPGLSTDKSGSGRDRLLLAIPVLTIGIFALDLLTPVGVAASVLCVLPLLLSIPSPRERDPIYFSTIATALIWIDLFLKPSGIPIPYGVFNRTLETLVLWGVVLGLIHYKPVQDGLISAESI